MNLSKIKLFNIYSIFLIFILSLILPLFDTDYLMFPFSLFALFFSLYILLKKNLAVYLSLIFIFLGTLVSVDIGFTFKATQFFSLFTLLNLVILYLKNDKDYNKFRVFEFYPFIIFVITILPSLSNPHFYSEFYEKVDSVKIFLNYIFLQIICFTLALSLNTKLKLINALKMTFTSFLLVLTFGFFQQIFYYLGLYDPNLYVGFHSLIVDYYGPFLRFSPGTFSNEFGEIIQTVLIFLSIFIYNFKDKISTLNKIYIYNIWLISVIALILNFTRISWIVYFLFILSFFGFSKGRIKEKLFLVLSIITIASITYFLYTETNIAVIVSIFDRFIELSELSSSSAGTRLEAWEISYNLFLESPIIGHGLGTASETHNVPLQLLAETGIQGLIGFYFLIFYLLNKFFKMIKRTEDLFLKSISIAVFYSLLSCVIFDFTNHGIYHFVLWLIIAFGLSIEKNIDSIHN